MRIASATGKEISQVVWRDQIAVLRQRQMLWGRRQQGFPESDGSCNKESTLG